MSTAPTKLDYAHASYITLSSKLSPLSIPSSAATSSDALSSSPDSASSSGSVANANALCYVGPVGALAHEHLYALEGVPTSNPPDEQVMQVKLALEKVQGVSNVEVMLPRARLKKDGFEC